MAYDEDLADRLRVALQHEDHLTEKTMFGGHAFLLRGHMVVAAGSGGGLLLRCDPAQTEALVAEPGVTRFEMRGRSMAGWLRVDASAVDGDDALSRWVGVGTAYVATLPAK